MLMKHLIALKIAYQVEKKHYGTKFTGVETELIWEGDADYPFEFGNIYDFLR